MRTIDSKDLKGARIDTAHPASAVGRLAVPRRNVRIAEGSKPRLTGGILIDGDDLGDSPSQKGRGPAEDPPERLSA